MGDRRRADALLTEALDLPEDEREAFLLENCGGDGALLRLVRELLADAERPDDFLRPGQALLGPLWDRASASLDGGRIQPGAAIGSWCVIREIGAGGMAEVYLAERSGGEFEQRAALKLIKRGIDTDEVVHRFRQERQILASLEHPNISRLLDGGISADGRPFFVMEYIDGLPIDAWCDENRVTVDTRLQLFLDVGRAVEQAHRKLVVHRDLKPSNILVDQTGKVKLLDFGIAKLLDPAAATHAAPATRTAVRVMTPEYASPEQVRGEPATTGSDVYQLGLLLYELLTGHRAHRFADNSLTEIERVICEQLPTRPSTIVGSATRSGDTLPATTAETRGITLDGLRRRLRGDLDNIVLKALSKEPEARYASVSALIEDVLRHIDGRPVAARRPTLGYRMGRFVRRNTVGVVAAGLVAVSVVAGLTSTLWQARIAQLERDNARREAATASRVSEFLIGTFQVTDPGEARGNSVTARELLESGTRRIGELSNEPEVQATMKDVMGRAYLSLGLNEAANALLTDALAMRQAGIDGPDPRVADSLDHVGLVLREQGAYDESGKHLVAGLEMRRELFGDSHEDVAVSLQHLARLEHIRANLERASELMGEALRIRQRLLGPDHPEVSSLIKDQAMLLLQRGDHEQAYGMLESVLTNQRRSLGDDHPLVAETLNSLGMAAQNLGRVEEASGHYNEALTIRRKVLGPTHEDTTATRNNLGALYYQQGDFEKAAPIFRETMELRQSLLGDDHPGVATSMNNLGVTLSMLGDLENSEHWYREALRIRLKVYGDKNPSVAVTRCHLGRLLRDRGKTVEAESSMRAGLRHVAEGDPNLPACAVDLAELLLTQERLDEAGPLLEEAVRLAIEIDGPEAPRTAAARSARGAWHLARGDFAAAEIDILAAWAILEGRPENDHRRRKALERRMQLERATEGR